MTHLKSIGWWLWVLLVSLLAGCAVSGTTETQVPEPTPIELSSQTAIAPANIPTATILLSTPSLASPTASATPPALPTQETSPSSTPVPRAEVEVTLLDCTTTFCPPEDLEHLANVGVQQPGILEVEILGELTARLIYDPTQLTEAEAVETFARAGRIEVEIVP